MEIARRYIFECPECKGKKVVEVLSEVTVRKPIINVDENNVEYLPPKVDEDLGIKDSKFICANCGIFIADTEEVLRQKMEKEFFVVEESFVDGIMDIFIDIEEEDTGKIKMMIRKFLLTRDIEVRVKEKSEENGDIKENDEI